MKGGSSTAVSLSQLGKDRGFEVLAWDFGLYGSGPFGVSGSRCLRLGSEILDSVHLKLSHYWVVLQGPRKYS